MIRILELESTVGEERLLCIFELESLERVELALWILVAWVSCESRALLLHRVPESPERVELALWIL